MQKKCEVTSKSGFKSRQPTLLVGSATDSGRVSADSEGVVAVSVPEAGPDGGGTDKECVVICGTETTLGVSPGTHAEDVESGSQAGASVVVWPSQSEPVSTSKIRSL